VPGSRGPGPGAGNTPGVSFREAGADDGPAVAAVFTAARALMTYLPRLHSAEEDVEFFSSIVLPSTTVTLAETGPPGSGAVSEVGAVSEGGAVSEAGAVIAFSSVGDGWLRHLYVTPSFQGRGIGGALLARAMAGQPAGLSLWVFEENHRARSLYARAGFVAMERTDGSGNEEQCPDIRMQWAPRAD
jgi:ribosomal protein S18 acetylase RimI-like enzyme